MLIFQSFEQIVSSILQKPKPKPAAAPAPENAAPSENSGGDTKQSDQPAPNQEKMDVE